MSLIMIKTIVKLERVKSGPIANATKYSFQIKSFLEVQIILKQTNKLKYLEGKIFQWLLSIYIY